MTPLSSTTLTGYLDTSAWWSFGYGNVIQPPFPGEGGPVTPTDGPSIFPMPNDRFAGAQGVQAGTITLYASAYPPTLEAGEPTYGGQVGSVWFRWVVPATGTARVSSSTIDPFPQPNAVSITPALSEESIFYPWGGIWHGGWTGSVFESNNNIKPPFKRHTFSAYRGEGLSTLTLIAHDNSLQFPVTAGEVIWLAIETYDASVPASFNLDFTPPPANDSFAAALSIQDCAQANLTGYLPGATREVGEPNLGSGFEGGSVWFKFSAATFGLVRFDWGANSYPTAIFEGDSLETLRLVTQSWAGSPAFFGHEGVTYWIAVYHDEARPNTFTATLIGPRYRLYETTVDELMPNGLVPHFYGLRGETLLLYAKTTTGWKCVETERIVNYGTDLLIRPEAVDGQLRVISIDEVLPSPYVQFSRARGKNIATLVGIPGQTCAVSYSSDLVNWTAPQIHTLQESRRGIYAPAQSDAAVFYRITQSLPETTAPKKQHEPPH